MTTVGPLPNPSELSPRDRQILLGLAERLDATDAGGHNNLGVLYFNKGMLEEAVEQFHLALEVDPAMPVARRNLELAYLSTGYYDRLVGDLSDVLASTPYDEAARWRLVRAHRHTGHFREAIGQLENLLDRSPEDSRYLLELGRAEKDADNFHKARAAYERALVVDPHSAVLHFHLGELFYHEGSSAEAKRALLRAIELAPEYAEALHLLSFVLGEAGESERAAEALGRARELGSWATQAEVGLSIDRHSTARYSELLGERAARPEVVREQYLARYHLGVAFRQKGLYDDALREFDRALEQGEDRTLVLQSKAEVLLVAGREAEAAELYGALVREHADSPKIWNELGVCHHRVGELREAEFCYGKAIELSPAYLLARNNLAVARANRGETGGARTAFQQLLADEPSFLEARCNLGLLALEEGRKREALGAFRAAVETHPLSSGGWLGIGAVLSETEELREARRALARAVELAPNSAEARYRLGFVLSRLGDVQGSLRETEKALGLNPYFTAPQLKLLIELQYEYAEVLAPEIGRQTRLMPEQGLANFELADGELSEIFAGLRSLTGDVPAGSASYNLARDYFSKGLLVRALAEVRRAALAGGDAVEEALLTGEIYRRQNLHGEALERFDTAIRRLEGTAWSEAHDRAWLGRGWSALALGRLDVAGQSAVTALGKRPDADEAVRLEAETLLVKGQSSAALDRFSSLSEDSPDDAPLLLRVGMAARAAGDNDRAREAFRRALVLDPDLPAVRVELGSLALEEGFIDEAIVHGHAALEALPGYAEAAMLVAEGERRRGAPENAITALADLLLDDPYHLEALTFLASVLFGAGRYDDAVTAYQRVLRFDNTIARAWEGLGDSLMAMSDSRGAVECWRRGLEVSTDVGTAKSLKRKLDRQVERVAPAGTRA